MEENKKEELQENAVEQETAEVQAEETEKKPVRQRSFTFVYLAAAYLLYTGMGLCRSVLNGEEGATWIFFVAGAVFIVVAILACVYAVRSTSKMNKALKEAMKAEAEKAKAEGTAEGESVPVKEAKKMSISERARMAGHLDDTEEENSEEENSEEESSEEDNSKEA